MSAYFQLQYILWKQWTNAPKQECSLEVVEKALSVCVKLDKQNKRISAAMKMISTIKYNQATNTSQNPTFSVI